MVGIDVKILAEQLDAAQAILDEIRVTCGCRAFSLPHETSTGRTRTALQAARKVFRDRQLRSDFIGSNALFGEPAWDMLLDLFIKQAENEELAPRSADVGFKAAISTELRWMKVLEQHGLIVSRVDPDDGDRLLIHLAPTGYEGMLRYLEAISR
jgi:hypothetical protein